MTTQIWSRFPTLAGFLKRIIVLHRVGDRCQRSCFLVSSIFSLAGTMNRLWDLNEFSDFLAPLVLSDLQVKLVPVMPCALCTPQILYRLSRARLIQILTIRTLCLHRDFVSYPTQLIQILRGSQHEKLPDSLLCKRSTSYLQRSKILHNWPLQWVGTYTNVMRSIKRETCTRHKKHSWLQERTTSSRPMPRLNLNSLLNFPSACSCSNSIVSYSITSESHP